MFYNHQLNNREKRMYKRIHVFSIIVLFILFVSSETWSQIPDCKERLLDSCQEGIVQTDLICKLLAQERAETKESLCQFLEKIWPLDADIRDDLICARLMGTKNFEGIPFALPFGTTSYSFSFYRESVYNDQSESIPRIVSPPCSFEYREVDLKLTVHLSEESRSQMERLGEKIKTFDQVAERIWKLSEPYEDERQMAKNLIQDVNNLVSGMDFTGDVIEITLEDNWVARDKILLTIENLTPQYIHSSSGFKRSVEQVINEMDSLNKRAEKEHERLTEWYLEQGFENDPDEKLHPQGLP